MFKKEKRGMVIPFLALVEKDLYQSALHAMVLLLAYTNYTKNAIVIPSNNNTNMFDCINSTFSCNPWEIFAYIFAPIVSKFKKLDYETVLQSKKQWYMQWQNFWIWIIIQYVLFWGILFLLYRWIDFSVNHIILFVIKEFYLVR